MKNMVNGNGEKVVGFYLHELGDHARESAIRNAYEAAVIYGDAIAQEADYWIEFLEENLGFRFATNKFDRYYVMLEDLHGQHECGLDFDCDIDQLVALFGRLPMHRLSDDDVTRQALWRSLDAAVDRLIQLLPEMRDWLQVGQVIGNSDTYGWWKRIEMEDLSDNIGSVIDERDGDDSAKIDLATEAAECEVDIANSFEAVVRWLEEGILQRVEEVFRSYYFGEGLESLLFSENGEEIWGDWTEVDSD